MSNHSAGTSSGAFDSDPLSTSSKARIHFPADASSPLRHPYPSPHSPPRASPLPFKTSPIRRQSPLNPQNAPATSRRRVRSADNPDETVEFPVRRRKPTNSLFTPPRGLDTVAGRIFEGGQEDNSSSLFSDEYDLSHEDPRILQDVQRALKLKARREARLGTKSTTMPSNITPPRPQADPLVTHFPFPVPPTSPTPRKESMTSDIDFSPSTGAGFLHPVPASLDNGATLDWSGIDDKPESRWKLSTSRRMGKEAMPPLNMVMDQQESAHAEKLARLRTTTTPNTLRKVKITRDQLGRRYSLIYGSLSTGTPLNIAKIARWYRNQDPLIRNSLEKAEPFTWLKHLDRRSQKLANRLHWNLSALIMEEHIQAQAHRDAMTTIPEDSPLPELSIDASISPSFKSPQFSATSRTSSNAVLGPSLARKSSLEDGVTFEPLVESTRTSLEVDSRRSDNSSFSSLPRFPNSGPSSPTNLLFQTRHFSPRLTESFGHSNGDSSVEHSLSDHSDRGSASRNDRLLGLAIPEQDSKIAITSDHSDDERRLQGAGITLKLTAPSPGITSDGDPSKSPSVPQPRPSLDRVLGRRRVRISLPSTDRGSKVHEDKHRQEADEERAYELKTRLLEEMLAHNHRVRQLLNRIAGSVRDVEAAQVNAASSLGISHVPLSRVLLEAFGHDPAAVTGGTRRFRGWKAVDDIQHRLVRQREVFQAFIAEHSDEPSVSKSVLDNSIESLISCLEALEVHRQKIAGRAAVVGASLKDVQAMHIAVKADYKSTLSHTSVVYPELSQIVALEESYKDQYQRIWEFGMDTLTFLLDTVTPFWRTYGKAIGEDIRDLLIIPLYRNEFTGEPKRYPIRGIPRRSFRHWLGLVLFFVASVIVNILQARAAISSAAHYKLPMIPYNSIRIAAIPFFWISILIQWWAVIAEFAIVLAQIGIITWWAGWFVRIFA